QAITARKCECFFFILTQFFKSQKIHVVYKRKAKFCFSLFFQLILFTECQLLMLAYAVLSLTLTLSFSLALVSSMSLFKLVKFKSKSNVGTNKIKGVFLFATSVK